ncbi:hypothetical protein Tco_1165927 [Tanacetum coccineum]
MKNLPDTVHMLQDVKGDRNCGFPSVAVALGLSEDHWPRIQSDLAWISKGGRVGRGAVGFGVTSLGWGELEGIGVDFISSFEGEVENGNDIRFLFDKWVGEIAFVGNEIGLEVLEGGFVRTLRSYKSYCKMLLSSLIVGIVGGGRFKRVVIAWKCIFLLCFCLPRYQGHVSAYFKDEGSEDYDTEDYDDYVEAQDDV